MDSVGIQSQEADKLRGSRPVLESPFAEIQDFKNTFLWCFVVDERQSRASGLGAVYS